MTSNRLLTFILLVLTYGFINSSCSHKKHDDTSDTFSGYKEVSLFNSTMKDSVSCYRIPAIIVAKNGNILAAIDERVPNCGDLRENYNINIVLRVSSDNGKTWSDICSVVDYENGFSASDPSFILDEIHGTIFLFFNYMNLKTEKNIYYFKYIKSNDNGQTWSKPVDITDQITKAEWKKDFKFITSGSGICTKSGELLHTIVNIQKGLYVFGSSDFGESWYIKDYAISPADESKIVELEDGSLMINSRVNNKGFRYVHISTDNGKTWNSKAEINLTDPGCNASIIRYSSIIDGDTKSRLLFSNANSSKDRVNMTIRISYDEGKTWTNGKIIYSGHSAYSSLCVLKNGNIALFYEKDNYSSNNFAMMSLDWLTDSKDTIK